MTHTNKVIAVLVTAVAVGVLLSVFNTGNNSSGTYRQDDLAGINGVVSDIQPADSIDEREHSLLSREIEKTSNQQSVYDYLSVIGSDDLRAFERAQRIADESMQRYPADFAIRWAPIQVEDVNLALMDSADDGPRDKMPRHRIRISPFPGVTIVAENEWFRDTGYGFSWRGKVVEGVNGSVSIHSVPEEAFGINVAFVSVNSDLGAFRIEPTSEPDIYVVYEANKLFNPPQH